MGGFGSIWHWLIVALIILVLFGRGKVSDLMGDFGKGVSSFKKGMAEAEDATKPAAQISPPAAPPSPAESTRTPEEEAAARRDPGG
jgi:sec-independent protein translocase protein TatA